MNVPIHVQRQADGLVSDIANLEVRAPYSFVVGRQATCDVQLEGDEVSRQHARVTLGPEGFVVEDLSSNGTMLSTGDVLRRSRAAFAYGAHLTIGPYRVTVGVPPINAPGARTPALGVSRPPPPPSPPPAPHARPSPSPHPSHPPQRSGSYHPVASSPPGGVPVHSPPHGVPIHPSAANGVPAYSSPNGVPVHPSAANGVPAYSSPNGVPVHPSAANGVPMYSPPGGMPAHPPVRGPITAGAALPPGMFGLPHDAAAVARARADSVAHSDDVIALRRKVHGELLKNLDFAKVDPLKADPSLRPRVLTALKRIVKDETAPILERLDRDAFIGELLEEALGLGPLEPLLADPAVTEVMVVDPATIYVERAGKLELTPTRFTDEERVRAVIERIVTPLGRRIDESQPLVDARLADGSRVNAIIRPLALRGSCITIRRFPKKRLMVDDFVRLGSITPRIATFLARAVVAKKNILISGGTGSGKTTLLNVLSASIPSVERIVTIEDAAELQLHQPHVVSLETKHANMEGKGAFTIRDLVKNSLRMRPDRIVVGECRGGEALDMLQAMNTGHDGSLTTIHANSPIEALARLETLVLMAGVELPSRAIREQISRSIHVIVQQSRFSDGSRKITHVSEIDELDPDGRFEVRPIFEYEQTGVAPDGTVIGDFDATGYMPSFLDELLTRGLIQPGEAFL